MTQDINSGRQLVLTADERSWKLDRPVLFLGDWCRRYARRHVWQAMDAVVAAPYGLAPAIRDRDHAWARSCEASLFPHLCAALNRHHGTEHGERYWRILLGHWFRRYVEVLLNRYQTLDSCLRAYRPSTVMVFSGDAYSLAPQDSYAAIRAFNDDHWNAFLYGQLLGCMDTMGLAIEILPPAKSHTAQCSSTASEGGMLQLILAWGIRQARNAGNYLYRAKDALIINSFLPRLDEIRLHLLLKQFPQQLAGRTGTLPTVALDRNLRRRLAAEITADQTVGLDRAISAMLFKSLPACYLEGYTELTSAAAGLPWPREPRFIFTSNNFDTDEVFKAWVAAKTEAGAPYIAGQHGNNYGTSRYMNPSVEEMTADRFITWGWVDGLAQHVPGFIFKTGSKTKLASNPQGGLLLIELHAAQMLRTWDTVAEYTEYFDEQLCFVGFLQSDIRQRLIVRLHHEFRNLDWDDMARWQAFDPSLRLETGEVRLGELIASSRLVVHSYDSTGILETLAQNIPTVAFWQNGFTHIRDSGRPYYQCLVEAGIVHLSPKSVTDHINTIWEDVGGWWASPSVQEARLQFCSRYARVSTAPVRELRRLLLDSSTPSNW